MNHNFSRRDFLKVAGVGLGAMAFRPFKLETYYDKIYTAKRLPQYPASEIIGRMTGMTDVHSRPSNDPLQATTTGVLYDDNLIEWGREVIGTAVGLTNQKYLETAGGYVWSSRVQPTRNLPCLILS